MAIRADLPAVQVDIGDRLESQFDGAEQQLHRPRKNRKARQSVNPSRFTEVRDGKRQALPATRDALQVQRQTGDLYSQSIGQRRVAERLGCMSESQMRQMLIPMTGNSYSMPSLPTMPKLPHSDDPTVLMQQFKGTQGHQEHLGNHMHRISRDSQQQMSLNRKIQDTYKSYEHMEQAAGLRQQALEAREGTLMDLGYTFEGMASGFSTAASSLESASDSVYAAANAMASIPGQGPALAAAFRTVASNLRASSRGLYSSGQGMKKMSRKMFIMSKKTYWSSLKAGIERKSLSCEKMRTRITLNQGSRRMKQIQNAQNRVGDAYSKSLQNQHRLTAQLKGHGPAFEVDPTQKSKTSQAVATQEKFHGHQVGIHQQQQVAEAKFYTPPRLPQVSEIASGAAKPAQFAAPDFKVPKMGDSNLA